MEGGKEEEEEEVMEVEGRGEEEERVRAEEVRGSAEGMAAGVAKDGGEAEGGAMAREGEERPEKGIERGARLEGGC